MGANLSSIFMDPNSLSLYCGPLPSSFQSSNPSHPCLGDLPESCVALILEYLDPQEIFKFARLNRAFRGASWADFVWESKLPSNYVSLLERVFGGDDDFPRKLNKREIYTILCRANTFDGGTKKVWLDKITGGVCLSICSKGLSITGIDDRRYWNHIPTEESRFQSVAYLQQIWWLEVDGQFEFPFLAGTYSLFFRLQLGRAAKKFGRRVCNTEHVHGWDIKPVRFQLWTSDGQYASSQRFLNDTGNWNLYHAGDFVVDSSNSSMNLKFSMTQIDCTHTKGGLCLDSVVVYPCKFKERLKHF
ncbi:F-box protein PP2-A12 [Ricinus communis]|uniref:ATPP2-A13, putative n=1 Tax=Ricinus communis TaxID=3988 RepID=B9RC28_RICCO|nr:F-box protein PP2-A12 [Ricinus communis]EEF51099.1 ATPP2-A13, putative [Ricinus communis]|eukprot:XP_002509712.1 F-box protein PP2-A12 [Ricinus communis]